MYLKSFRFPMFYVLLSMLSVGCGSSSGTSEKIAPIEDPVVEAPIEDPVVEAPLETVSYSPTAFLNFPVRSEVMTLDDTITLYGATTKSESIASITVNNQSVTSEDDFKTWQVTLTLSSQGNESVDIVVTDLNDDNHNFEDALLIKQREAIALEMGKMEYDAELNRLYYYDSDLNGLYYRDLETGRVSELNTFGQWDQSVRAVYLLLSEDKESMFYADTDKNISKLNLTTGVSTPISLNANFTEQAAEFRSITYMTWVENELHVVNSRDPNKGIFKINLEDGSRTEVHSLHSLDISSAGYSPSLDRFFIGSYRQILAYDVETDTRTVLTSYTENDELLTDNFVNDLAVIDDGLGAVRLLTINHTVDDFYFVEVDLNDSGRTKLELSGSELDINEAGELYVDQVNAQLFIEDSGINQLYKVNLDAMERKVIGDDFVNINGEGFWLNSNNQTFSVNHNGTAAIALQENGQSLIELSVDTGTVNSISIPENYNDRDYSIKAYSPETGQAFLTRTTEISADVSMHDIFMLDTKTGELTLLISEQSAETMLFNPDTKRLYISVYGDSTVYEFDISDPENIIKSGKTCDIAIANREFYLMAMDIKSGQILVYDDYDSDVFLWNFNSGECTFEFNNSDLAGTSGGIDNDHVLFDSVHNRFVFRGGDRNVLAAYNLETGIVDVLLDNVFDLTLSKSVTDVGATLYDGKTDQMYIWDERSAALESINVKTKEHAIHIH